MFLVVSLVCCKSEGKPPEGDDRGGTATTHEAKETREERWYRVTLRDSDVEIPFLLSAPHPPGASGTLTVANGGERFAYEYLDEDGELVAEDEVFGTLLRFRVAEDGTLTGAWEQDHQTLELRGEPVADADARHRFPEGAKPTVNVSGDWALDICDVGKGRATFRQREDGVVTGALIPQNIGDARYLSGQVDGNRLRLSTFDGQHLYLFSFDVSAGGKAFDGYWHYPGWWKYSVHGKKGSAPPMEALYTAEVSSENKRISLPGLDEYRGHPVIVDLFGTWCPACLDLTPFLVDLERRYRSKGLKVLSIDYEHKVGKGVARERLGAFAKKYDIPWEVRLEVVEDLADALPPELVNVQGFPVTLFVDRKGAVLGIHTGFISPAAPAEHKALLKKFESWVEQIVASEA